MMVGPLGCAKIFTSVLEQAEDVTSAFLFLQIAMSLSGHHC
jgi:hypothetical protein